MVWRCAAIDHGVAFHNDGTIAPCCLISHTYKKPISEINNNPFADLKESTPPLVCQVCVDADNRNIQSYRRRFNEIKSDQPGFQFVDIRNTNVCNFKCRTCGPQSSHLWATELGKSIPIKHFSLSDYKHHIVNDSVQEIYYTGGEPLINPEHWELLEELTVTGMSKNITLQYSSNMSVLKFKDKDIFDVWKNFKSVKIMASIDAIGEKFDHIRSGGTWAVANENIQALRKHNVKLSIAATVSILNLWFLEELLIFFNDQNISVELTNLYYPDYLSLTVIPDELRTLALNCVDNIEKIYHDKHKCDFMREQLNNNINQSLFRDTVMQTLLLDKIRGEKLFDFLPFRDYALKLV